MTDDEELERRVHDAFKSATAPRAPISIRERVSELPTANMRSGPRFHMTWAVLGAILVVLVVAISRSYLPANTGTVPPQSPEPTAQVSTTPLSSLAESQNAPGAVDLLLPGPLTGNGWKVVANGIGLRRKPTDIPGIAGVQVVAGRELAGLHTILRIPDTTIIDPRTQAALVVDLWAGDGPICGQERFDGVDFDQVGSKITVRYSDAALVTPLPSGTLCALDAREASILVAIDLSHIPTSPVTVAVARFGGGGWADVATVAASFPSPSAKP